MTNTNTKRRRPIDSIISSFEKSGYTKIVIKLDGDIIAYKPDLVHTPENDKRENWKAHGRGL